MGNLSNTDVSNIFELRDALITQETKLRSMESQHPDCGYVADYIQNVKKSAGKLAISILGINNSVEERRFLDAWCNRQFSTDNVLRKYI